MEKTQLKHDAFVQATFVNLYSYAARNNNTITIRPFDTSKKEYLYVLEVAKEVAGFFNFTIEAEIPLWKRLFFKQFKTIKRPTQDGIFVPKLILFMCRELEIPREEVEVIYEEYFNKH